jgi:N-acetylneuraminate synthase/N,N'-diacetyllegionaminate synthase
VSKVLIIAEIGINHDGNMNTARDLIEKAKWAGADVAKFQLYDVDKIFPNRDCSDERGNWYEKVKRTQLTKEQAFYLAGCCEGQDIEFMASAFDLERVDWLEEIGVKRHKIALRSNKDSDLLDTMLKTRKELLISCSYEDRSLVYHLTGRVDVKSLYCVPEYPTEPTSLHLEKVKFRGLEFQGFSDHSIGTTACLTAVARGATIIEKHFTYAPLSNRGPDHLFSAHPRKFKEMVKIIREMERCLG